MTLTETLDITETLVEKAKNRLNQEPTYENKQYYEYQLAVKTFLEKLRDA